jgi:hypothetical protein
MNTVFNYIFPVLITLFLLLGACKDSQNEVQNYDYSISAQESKRIEMHLDSLTPPDTEMLQFLDFNESGKSMLALLNKEINAIYIFDTLGQIEKTLKFDKENVKKVKINGFRFINNDSLLLFNYALSELYLSTSHSLNGLQKVKTLKHIDDQKYMAPFFMVNINQPFFFNNGTIYITGKAKALKSKDGLKKERSYGIAFNINDTNNIAFASVNSNVWEERFWHNEQYYVQQDFCTPKNKIIFSFPMKDSIIIYDLVHGVATKHYAGSDYVKSEESMYPKKKMSFEDVGKLKDVKAFLELPAYKNIIYDKYRDMYIRVFSNGKKFNTLILLDSNCNKIGETRLPSDYLTSSGHFVNRDGLYLRKNIQRDESKIVFTLFTVNKK